MSHFAHAISVVLRHEGGYVDDHADPGGATNYGLSSRFLKSLGLDVDVRSLSQADAISIYKQHIWDKNNYDLISDREVATKIFDLAVNMGPRQAHTLLQRALRACGERDIIEDGILGPRTLTATNRASPQALLAALRSEAAGFYRLLAAQKPMLQKFLGGWLKRAYT